MTLVVLKAVGLAISLVLACLYYLEWILCQEYSIAPCLMEKNCSIYQECRNANHFIYTEPYTDSDTSGFVKPGELIMVSETIRIANKTFGKLTNQSLVVCQTASIVGYVCLSEEETVNFLQSL